MKCHVSEDEWSFRNIGERCVDCHQNIHKGYIQDKFYSNQDCTSCHNSDSWASVKFDHSLTDWPLEGAHLNVDCRACHFEEIDNQGNYSQSFENLSTECVHCHENIHGDQFEEQGSTDCIKCHVTVDWEPINFDHSKTKFSLEGKHAEIECKACHNNFDEETKRIIYQIEKFECIDCHG